MKPVKCPNNHYYDAEKYSECPHCAKEGILSVAKDEKSAEPAQEKHASEKKHFSLFKRNNSKNRDDSKKGRAQTESEVFSSTEINSGAFAEPEESEGFVEFREDEELEKTVKLNIEKAPASEMTDENRHIEADDVVANETESRNDSSLYAAVKATNSVAVSQDSKTVCFFNAETGTEPVVGWLVCVRGNYMGDAFMLKSGRNNVGRLVSMDVALAKEPSVSRDRHAVIIFEPNKGQFIIQAGESNGLTYLNGELVVTYNELKGYDHITLGKCELVFVPFCGEMFSWNDYVQE